MMACFKLATDCFDLLKNCSIRSAGHWQSGRQQKPFTLNDFKIPP